MLFENGPRLLTMSESVSLQQGTNITSERKIHSMEITCERNVQVFAVCKMNITLMDITLTLLSAEQLTRTFEVLIFYIIVKFSFGLNFVA